MRRLATALGLAACCALLSACVAVQPKPDGTMSYSFLWPGSTVEKVAQSPKPPAPVKVAKASKKPRVVRKSSLTTVGRSLSSGVWKATVESAKLSNKLPNGAKPKTGHKLLLLAVTVQNTGISSVIDVNAEQFTLKAPNGTVLPLFPTALPAFNAQQVRPVSPGMGTATVFVYEVPSNATGYRFFAKPMQDGSELMWTVL